MRHFFNPAASCRLVAVGDPAIRLKLYWRPYFQVAYEEILPPDGAVFRSLPVFGVDEAAVHILARREGSFIVTISLSPQSEATCTSLAVSDDRRLEISDLLSAGPNGSVYAEISDIPIRNGRARDFVAHVDLRNGAFREVGS